MNSHFSDRAVWSMLENNRCKRVSLKGLISDNPGAYKSLESALIKEELFHLLTALVNRRDSIDKQLEIYINHKNDPIVFERKEKYSLPQCEQICKIAGIDEGLIHQYSEVKKA